MVLDHDGSDLTRRCLQSLRATDWPSDALSVVLVDNSPSPSTRSASRLAPDFPDVTVVDAGGNRGFAGGCNLGIAALGAVDYVALLNNDATVEPGWLEPLVAALEADPSVGAACPKILFDGSFAELTLQSPTAVPGGGDRRSLGVAVRGVRLDGQDATRTAQLVDGFWGLQHDGAGSTYQWTNGDARMRVPARPDGGLPDCALLLSAAEATTVVATSGDLRTELTVRPEAAWFEVALGGPTVDVINNVGSVLLDGGYGADRGVLETDHGRYEEVEEVFAWCGAA
ncbi:MAG: glycosyltransferase, partial [Acidimicrobiales bacterium]